MGHLCLETFLDTEARPCRLCQFLNMVRPRSWRQKVRAACLRYAANPSVSIAESRRRFLFIGFGFTTWSSKILNPPRRSVGVNVSTVYMVTIIRSVGRIIALTGSNACGQHAESMWAWQALTIRIGAERW